MSPFIRKATLSDRPAIHLAHMRSIREVCVKDHGDEIKGWGYRELGERWIEGINNGLVWVIEYKQDICGLACIKFLDSKPEAIIQALYLTPEVLGQGLARKLMHLMLQEAHVQGVTSISLDSSLTAHEFYKHVGFRDSGPKTQTIIGGHPVSNYPMRYTIKDKTT
jgi:GNAT superfamily N-acetyltransferase